MTLNLRLTVAALALSSAFAVPALAEGETAATVVARVNGAEITLGEMVAVRESLPPQYLSMPDQDLFNAILEQLTNQEVLAQTKGALTVRDNANLTNAKRGYLASSAVDALAKAAVTDEALQAAFDARREFSASHILVQSEDEAKAIKAELDGGADFATLAKEKSIDTGSGANGGSLGWFGRGMMVPPFEAAVVAATEGTVTEPVQSNFGWHLILVHESRKPEDGRSLDDLRDELAGQIENEAIEAGVATLVAGAKIENSDTAIDPALLKNTALID